MTYDEMKLKYPNKEIKLVPAESEYLYLNWGFKTIDTCKMPANGRVYYYCFMIDMAQN